MKLITTFRPFFILFVAVMAFARGTKYFVSPAVTMLLIGMALGCLLAGLLAMCLPQGIASPQISGNETPPQELDGTYSK